MISLLENIKQWYITIQLTSPKKQKWFVVYLLRELEKEVHLLRRCQLFMKDHLFDLRWSVKVGCYSFLNTFLTTCWVLHHAEPFRLQKVHQPYFLKLLQKGKRNAGLDLILQIDRNYPVFLRNTEHDEVWSSCHKFFNWMLIVVFVNDLTCLCEMEDCFGIRDLLTALFTLGQEDQSVVVRRENLPDAIWWVVLHQEPLRQHARPPINTNIKSRNLTCI